MGLFVNVTDSSAAALEANKLVGGLVGRACSHGRSIISDSFVVKTCLSQCARSNALDTSTQPRVPDVTQPATFSVIRQFNDLYTAAAGVDVA